MSAPEIRRAEPSELKEIELLLEESGLPTEGVRDHLAHFFVVRNGSLLQGTVGLEQYGPDGLLRSLAVRASDRSRGLGGRLTEQVLREARSLGVRRLILLTTTAEKYFSARGFRVKDRAQITGDVRRSAEFTGACPESAVCMELTL
ncbi:MAG TPA: arsenic resistance N-acetyltransferase ArsN2 [Bacteroidota bacterium]|nr:arsenic resistance N-acetyltransferase ArsN2 [Bacteroidota bacterium]